jgi:hypothetical protein
LETITSVLPAIAAITEVFDPLAIGGVISC